jgi:hypothetical protein
LATRTALDYMLSPIVRLGKTALREQKGAGLGDWLYRANALH